MKPIAIIAGLAALLLTASPTVLAAPAASPNRYDSSSNGASSHDADPAREKLKAQQKDQRDKLKSEQKDERDKLKSQQKDQRDKLAAEQKLQRDKLHADQRNQWEKLKQTAALDDNAGPSARTSLASARH